MRMLVCVLCVNVGPATTAEDAVTGCHGSH